MNTKIVIFEDEVVVAEGIRAVLQELGYAVAGLAHSAEAGLQIVTETSPDLVLMDIRLKGTMDGITAAEQIRARADIPVVYLTAHGCEATLQRAKLSQPFGYVIKPFEARDLRTAIEVALHNHQMERRLTESEARYRRIVETAQEGVWILDAEARTTFANRQMAEMLGCKEEQMTGRLLFDFMDEAARLEAEGWFGRRKQGIKEQHDFRFRRKDGSVLWAIVSSNPLFDAAGRFTGALGMIVDITERKQAEAERERVVRELGKALVEVKTLSGIIPICAGCKKIRDDQGFWSQVEAYISKHSLVKFSHGLCPDCIQKYYPGYTEDELNAGASPVADTKDTIQEPLQGGEPASAQTERPLGATEIIYPQLFEAAESPGKGSADSPRGSETILLVEDTSCLRQLIRRALQGYGYTVLEAVHGEQAIQLAGTHPGTVHLLVLDLLLPGISGHRLAKRLGELKPGIKVLFISGSTADAVLGSGVLDSGTAFLQKPFSMGALASKVREVLER